MKYLIALVVLGLLIGGGVVYWQYRDKNTGGAGGNVQKEAVVRRDIEKLITANGKIASNKEIDIKCQASGKVIKLPFDIGKPVKPGDLLLELDPVDMIRSLKQAEAQVKSSEIRVAQAKLTHEMAEMNLVTTSQRVNADLTSAKARLDDARAKAKREQELFNAKYASSEQLETAKTALAHAESTFMTASASILELDQQKIAVSAKFQDIALAESQLSQDRVRRDLAQQQKDYTQVVAPEPPPNETADYRVSELNVQVGAIVQSGSGGFSGGTSVMKLSDLSHIYVLASVDESDIEHVNDPETHSVKQRVRITSDSREGVDFEGEVVRVKPKGDDLTNVVTFEVKVEVTSSNRLLLRPGATATVNIISLARSNTLTIPVAAFKQEDKSRNNATPGTTRAAATSAHGESDAGPSAATRSNSPTATAPGRRGRGGRGRGGSSGAGPRQTESIPLDAPKPGTVQVVSADGTLETRNVVVALAGTVPYMPQEGDFYEVISGLQEGETVAINRMGSESRWSGQGRGQGGSFMPRGVGGGGGGGRR